MCRGTDAYESICVFAHISRRKTASGKSVLKNTVAVGSGAGATVGCLRLDLTEVNESVLYVEMTCAGQEIWLCAGAAGETPVDPDQAFEGS